MILFLICSLCFTIYDRQGFSRSTLKNRTILPSNSSTMETIFWSIQKFLYIIVFPFRLIVCLYYWYNPREQSYYRYIVNSSMILFVSQKNDKQFLFKIKNARYPFKSKLVEDLSPTTIEIIFSKEDIHLFKIDDRIVERSSYWGHLLLILAVITHPMVHSYSNRNRKYNPEILFNLHSQHLNASAYYFPAYTIHASPNIIFKTLVSNSVIPISIHDKKLKGFKEYKIMLKFRERLKKFYFQNNIGSNFESFFICSFVHSLDHYFAYKYSYEAAFMLNGRNIGLLHHYIQPIYLPYLNNKLVNVKKFSSKWNVLYQSLKGIDDEYLNNIMLSLAV